MQMRRNALILGALSLVFAATTAQAQDKPSFAGSWTLVVDPNAPAPGRGGGGGLGQAATITQDAKMLTITRTTQNGEVKTVINLDGTESKNMMMGRGGTQTEQVSKAHWDGTKLVVTTSFKMGETAVERKQAFQLDATGQLVVETTSPGRDGGEPMTTKQTYKKG
jgi:hypothetical protein